MLLSDGEIRDLCVLKSDFEEAHSAGEEPWVSMIDPFSEGVQGDGKISYGLTSAGYDLRLAEEILAFKSAYGEWVDPKRFGDDGYRGKMLEPIDVLTSREGSRFVVIPPNGCVLGRSYEYLRIPRHLKGRCVGKSTYARCHVFPNITPLEPGWEGHLTIEISNIGPNPVKVYIMEGIAQLEFEIVSGTVETSYSDKGGKYNKQLGVTPAKVL